MRQLVPSIILAGPVVVAAPGNLYDAAHIYNDGQGLA
jgi:hypothetical protein